MKFLFLLTCILAYQFAMAQNVGVNQPNPTSALDIKSLSANATDNAMMIRNNNGDTLFKLNNDGYATLGSIQKDIGQLQIISNAKLGDRNLRLTGTNVYGNTGLHFSDIVWDGTHSDRYWRLVSRVYGPQSMFNSTSNSALTLHNDSLSNIMVFSGDGKIGVGTGSPTGYFEIRKDANDLVEVIPHINLIGTGLANRSYIYFNTSDNSNNKWLMRAQYNGSLGNFIIATNDQTKFAINEDGKTHLGGPSGISNGQVNIGYNSSVASPHLLLYEPDNDFSRVSFMNSNSTSTNWQIAGYVGASTAQSRLNFYNNLTGDLMSIAGDGRVGIGRDPLTAATSSRLQLKPSGSQYALALESAVNTNKWEWVVNGSNDLQAWYNGALRGTFNSATGAYVAASDRQLKKNIAALPKALNRIMKLKAYQYHYLDNAADAPLSYGFMAREIQQWFPDAVLPIDGMGNQQMLGINYQAFTVLAIKGIQEQQQTIQALEERIQKLEKIIEALKR